MESWGHSSSHRKQLWQSLKYVMQAFSVSGLSLITSWGQIISHLYAAGCNGMGGMVMWGHGLHVAWAVTSGRLAGMNAADITDKLNSSSMVSVR